jgi:hypothetical protein
LAKNLRATARPRSPSRRNTVPIVNAADFDKLSESEKQHFYKCRCGEMVDMRQLDDVLFHETDHKQRPDKLRKNSIHISLGPNDS